MNIFLSLLGRYKALLLLTLLGSALSAGAGIALINEINRFIADPSAIGEAPLWQYGLLLLVLFGGGFGAQSLLTTLGHRVVYELRMMMVKRVLDTDIERLEQIGAAKVYATLTQDIPTIGSAFNRLPAVLYNGILVGGGLAYLGWLSWELLILSVGMLLLGTGLAQVMLTRMRVLMKVVRETDDMIYSGYQGAIEGRNELALNEGRKRQFYEQEMEPAVERARVFEVRADRYWMLALNWMAALILSLGLVTFLAGDWLGVATETVVAYVLVLLFLRTPLSDLVGGLPQLIAGGVALQKIDSLTLAPHRSGYSKLPHPPVKAAPGAELLTLENVTYNYPKEADEQSFHLGPVNLSVRAGEILFIVGGNGSGKSTLAKILTGLYRPTTGTVKLNGIVITEETRAWYRSHFSTVFSTFHLFEHLVGPGEGFDADLAQAFLNRLQMQRKVAIHGSRLTTRSLSQGQRKRLALLVAYVEERPILLLDEWAADQDPTFRSFFYLELLPELQKCGKSIIAISHDDRYFDVADRVFKCESGTLRPSNTVASTPEMRRGSQMGMAPVG